MIGFRIWTMNVNEKHSVTVFLKDLLRALTSLVSPNAVEQDSDVSIRKRALELVYALVNESNVKTLTKELIEYLKVSDPEFKPDLTAKICALVQK